MNTLEKYRPIFERFDNVNLLFLMRDLEKQRMAIAGWTYRLGKREVMCPIAHQVPHKFHGERGYFYFKGCDSKLVVDFVFRWDMSVLMFWWPPLNRPNTTKKLLSLLRSIWQERLDDADTMQEMLKENRHEQTPLTSNCQAPGAAHPTPRAGHLRSALVYRDAAGGE